MLKTQDQDLIQHCHLRVNTDLNEIAQVLKWFEQFQYQQITADLRLRAQIVLVEGFTNAVRHAHQYLSEDTPIDIDVNLFSRQLEICIWDHGEPFDFETFIDDVDADVKPEEREAHWGGMIFRNLSLKYGWTIKYWCPAMSNDDRNCLIIQMPL
jgi:serine/threonine-protein kinase RsbW